MSAVGEVAARLLAAVEDAGEASSSLEVVVARLAEARGRLASAWEGSSHDSALAALAQLDRAVEAVEEASALLRAAGEGIREYVAEALGVAGGSAGAPGPVPVVVDPERLGALGAAFRPGVHDPGGSFSAKERAIADRLAAEGWHVTARTPDHGTHRRSNPDAVIRRSPDDVGTVTEFKTPTEPASRTARREILVAGRQLRGHGGGDVVLDCRPAGLGLDEAERGLARAAGQARQHGQQLPLRTWVILPTGELRELGRE